MYQSVRPGQNENVNFFLYFQYLKLNITNVIEIEMNSVITFENQHFNTVDRRHGGTVRRFAFHAVGREFDTALRLYVRSRSTTSVFFCWDLVPLDPGWP